MTAEARERKRERDRHWRLKNKEHLQEYRSRPAYKQKRREAQKLYYRANKQRILQYARGWRSKNKTRVAAWKKEYEKRRYETDQQYRERCRLKSYLSSAIKQKGTHRSRRLFALVGCYLLELRAHIETQFKPGMSWDNYGDWHIDHIRPCSGFDLTDPEQRHACFHYTNLQPLWAPENRAKSATTVA